MREIMDPREISLPWAANKSHSNFHMVDVTAKSPTTRRAEATGIIRMSPSAFALVRDGKLPKGDALSLAEVSGILSAKQTPSLLPLCHPLPLEEIRVSCELEEKTTSVRVTCQVSTTAKTGVEMEALMGTSGALLCLYDLIKMVDPALVLEQVRLNYKEGGKKGLWRHPEANRKPVSRDEESNCSLTEVKCAVVTVSDRVSRGKTEDQSGPVAASWLKEHGAKVVESCVVPDEKEQIQTTVRAFVEKGLSFVVTTGGTGMGPRDVTVSALSSVSSKEMKGFGELLRHNGSIAKKSAWLSNATAFVMDKTLIVVLPGNPNAVAEGLSCLRDLIPHSLHVIRDGNHG